MAKYRKKPVVIDAIQVGDANVKEVEAFLGNVDHSFGWHVVPYPHWAISTLEGTMEGRVTDWIIKGVAGEFYPCKPDIFEATYEPA